MKPYLFFKLAASKRCVVNCTLRPPYPPKIDQVPIIQKVGRGWGRVWSSSENTFTGVRTPDRPVRSGSVYRLWYLEIFHENPSIRTPFASCGQTEKTTLLVAFSDLANAPKFVIRRREGYSFEHHRCEEWPKYYLKLCRGKVL